MEIYPGSALGEFLRSRRARLRPEELGLRPGVRRRRVAGLRREEVAPLAGVSVGYYTRLEQGQSPNVSDDVLDAVARVLRLDEDEVRHLHRLARVARARESVRPERSPPRTATSTARRPTPRWCRPPGGPGTRRSRSPTDSSPARPISTSRATTPGAARSRCAGCSST
ncbi:hypothetical protein DMB42_51045 [Nonomuraea sp. WAC 01424]|nr:hypothetical protein DMB42_51045 [Nonomuraea sp. WAC 01424]